MTNEKVVEKWTQGKQGKSLHMETNGKSLFSYRMKIGETWKGKTPVKVVLNVQSPYFYSHSTSHHVSIAKLHADKVLNPVRIKDDLNKSIWYLFPCSFE